MNLTLFYLIGFIKSYSGGFSIEESIYQRISFVGDNFEISESKKETFKKLTELCEKTLTDAKVSNDINVEYWANKKGAIIYSKNIVELICDFFKSKDSFTENGRLVLDEYLFDEFEWNNEESFSYQQRLSFLCGAFESNGNDNELYFYNDYKKCLLVHYLLKCFADEDDKIQMESYFKTPYTDYIVINKNGNIWNEIKKYCS